ncbi:unnamed protein product [Dibothriocephalus latus]|uniref:MAP3K TRAFs-binding domain-containing protein n=1 Tax=Dibothriocephalus latus TaxID=60516 RepID=A0A3P6RAB5_DIBLA|nr:unnamed protein product [Dibothriocephalus latus]
MYGLVGRIHKDRFIESDYTDKEALKLAIDGYRRGFERHHNEYLGVNLATLLVIDGADMSSGQELQCVCELAFNAVFFFLLEFKHCLFC